MPVTRNATDSNEKERMTCFECVIESVEAPPNDTFCISEKETNYSYMEMEVLRIQNSETQKTRRL